MNRIEGVLFIIFSVSYMFFILMMFNLDGKTQDLEKELEQKEWKIEMLQEENSLLHDEVFNLNQALMKETE